jgi:hypothetical protein
LYFGHGGSRALQLFAQVCDCTMIARNQGGCWQYELAPKLGATLKLQVELEDNAGKDVKGSLTEQEAPTMSIAL